MLPKFCKLPQRRELMLRILVILGILGMGCILLSSLLPERQEPAAAAGDSVEDYRMQLETELTEMLSVMEGVGEVQVLVTLAGSEEYCYAKADDRTVTDTQTRSSVSYVTVGGSREALLETVTYPGITGVVVACEGGASPVVQESVNRAVAVACGLSLNQIYVTKLSARKGDLS